jgi:protein phosphatase PTC7
MEEKKSLEKSYAQVVKESTPPRKRQDLKISPLKENIPPARLVDQIEKPQVLKEELPQSAENHNLKKALSGNSAAIKEFNKSLLDSNTELTIGEYIKIMNERIYKIDPQFLMDFMMLVERDDCCIHSDLLKAYGIQSKTSSSTKALKLFEKFDFVEGKDYRMESEIIGKNVTIFYFMTPIVFKKLLLRSKNTDIYANYYMILEKCIYYYHQYQIELERKKCERLMSRLAINEEKKSFDFSFGQALTSHKEDAVWIGENAGILAFCVVDGIGGYRMQGIDSGDVARTFAKGIEESLMYVEEASELSAERLLMNGWRLVKAKRHKGGITLIVGFIDQNLHMRFCQIGDCDLFVLRETTNEMIEIIYRSKKQEIKFNTPRMLSHDCPDGVEQAWSVHLALKQKDVIFACSDGFLDNVSLDIFKEHEYRKLVLDSPASAIQKILLKKAFEISESTNDTPFSRNTQSRGLKYSGGKIDDITLIVIKI